MLCALDELYGLGSRYELTRAERLQALTAEQVRSAAAGLFATNHVAVSVVLPEQSAVKP